jgi:hypothetical protein
MANKCSYDKLTAKFLAAVAENMPDMSEEAMRRFIRNPTRHITLLMKILEELPQLSSERIEYFIKNPDTLAPKLRHLQPKPLHEFLKDDRFELFRIQKGCNLVLLRSKAFPGVAILISNEAVKILDTLSLNIYQGFEKEIYGLPCWCCRCLWIELGHTDLDVMMNILEKARTQGIQKILMRKPQSVVGCDKALMDATFVNLEDEEALHTLHVEMSPFDIIIKRSEDNSPFTTFCEAK